MAGGVITTRTGAVIRCDYIILALAPSLYGRFQFEPALPGLRSQLTQRMPMGCIIKTNMFYETAWWRDTGFSGSLFSNKCVLTAAVDDCRVHCS